MYHFQEAITNNKGDALTGYYVKVADPSDNSLVDIYADENLTPIISDSGLANAALVDSDGNCSFWIANTIAHIDIYGTDGTTLARRIESYEFGLQDADYGDVSVTSNGDVWTVQAVNGTTPTSVGIAVLGAATQAAARTAIGAGTGTGDLVAANNLSDVANASTARTNLGLGTAATQASTAFCQTANNLSDLGSAASARANLGLLNVITDSTTARTAALSDGFAFVRFTNSSAVTFTIPPNSSVAFPVGVVIEFAQAGTGAVSVAAGVGVTVNSRAADLTLAGQYAVAFVRKVDTDTWIMNGDL